MIRQTYQFDIITPCFCSGAEPEKQAEIRPASIRGQLRWWFRVLGGFRSLASMELRAQEDLIFGSAAGEEGSAGKLIVRVVDAPVSNDVRDDVSMKATVYDDRGYILWPLRTVPPTPRSRAVINGDVNVSQTCHRFALHVLWRGDAARASDLKALIAVFGHLGSLGFRSRRAMGALALAHSQISLRIALSAFATPDSIDVRSLPANNPDSAINILAQWLKKWRAHGRSNKNAPERGYPGFGYAQSDHDAAEHHIGPGYRAALGMPMMAKYGDWSAEKPDPGKQIKGRFASPILLRPHRAEDGSWLALVIFVNAMTWDVDTQIFLTSYNRPTQKRRVSLDLYEAMKSDLQLKSFPPA